MLLSDHVSCYLDSCCPRPQKRLGGGSRIIFHTRSLLSLRCALSLSVGRDLAQPQVPSRPELAIHFHRESWASETSCRTAGQTPADLLDILSFKTPGVSRVELAAQQGTVQKHMLFGQRCEQLQAFFLKVLSQLQLNIAHSEAVSYEVAGLRLRECSLRPAFLHDLLHGDVEPQVSPDFAVEFQTIIHVRLPECQQWLAECSNLACPSLELGAFILSLEHSHLPHTTIPLGDL